MMLRYTNKGEQVLLDGAPYCRLGSSTEAAKIVDAMNAAVANPKRSFYVEDFFGSAKGLQDRLNEVAYCYHLRSVMIVGDGYRIVWEVL